MPHGRGRRDPFRAEMSRLRAQVQTLKMEMKDSNIGRFRKKSACVRLPPHEEYAKMYSTVRIQHGSSANSGTMRTSIVFGGCKPAFGWYARSVLRFAWPSTFRWNPATSTPQGNWRAFRRRGRHSQLYKLYQQVLLPIKLSMVSFL